MKKSAGDWWDYQASQLFSSKGKPKVTLKIPSYRSNFDPKAPSTAPKAIEKVEPPPAMIVEESTASDTAIQKIIKFWTGDK